MIGNKIVQLFIISWSKRNRGKDARTKTIELAIIKIFKIKIIEEKYHPPKNNKTISVENKSIDEYSPKKKKAKTIPEYSTL